MEKLWERMAEIYGHTFTSSYGLVPSETWAKGLHDIRSDELARGLAGCVQQGGEWPPNLSQFRALCRPQRACAAHAITPVPALPKPKNAEVGRAALRGLRAMGLSGAGQRKTEIQPANETAYFTDPVTVERERERALAALAGMGLDLDALA